MTTSTHRLALRASVRAWNDLIRQNGGKVAVGHIHDDPKWEDRPIFDVTHVSLVGWSLRLHTSRAPGDYVSAVGLEPVETGLANELRMRAFNEETFLIKAHEWVDKCPLDFSVARVGHHHADPTLTVLLLRHRKQLDWWSCVVCTTTMPDATFPRQSQDGALASFDKRTIK